MNKLTENTKNSASLPADGKRATGTLEKDVASGPPSPVGQAPARTNPTSAENSANLPAAENRATGTPEKDVASGPPSPVCQTPARTSPASAENSAKLPVAEDHATGTPEKDVASGPPSPVGHTSARTNLVSAENPDSLPAAENRAIGTPEKDVASDPTGPTGQTPVRTDPADAPNLSHIALVQVPLDKLASLLQPGSGNRASTSKLDTTAKVLSILQSMMVILLGIFSSMFLFQIDIAKLNLAKSRKEYDRLEAKDSSAALELVVTQLNKAPNSANGRFITAEVTLKNAGNKTVRLNLMNNHFKFFIAKISVESKYNDGRVKWADLSRFKLDYPYEGDIQSMTVAPDDYVKFTAIQKVNDAGLYLVRCTIEGEILNNSDLRIIETKTVQYTGEKYILAE